MFGFECCVVKFDRGSFYDGCGIETSWRPAKLPLNSPRVVYSDDLSGMLWDMVFATAIEHEARNLVFLSGLPRRQTLLLDSDPKVVQDFIDELHSDFRRWLQLKAVDKTWAAAWQKRSAFQKMSVQQLVACFELEAWKLTQR